jgi:hypothetical protein
MKQNVKLVILILIFQTVCYGEIFSQLLKIEYEEFTAEYLLESVNYYFDVQNKTLLSQTSGYAKEHLYQYEIFDFVYKTRKKINSNTHKIKIDTIKVGDKLNRMQLTEKNCDDNEICTLKYCNYLFNPYAEGDTSVLDLEVEVDFKHELGDILFKEYLEYIPSIEVVLNSERGIILYYEHRESDFSMNTYRRKFIGYSYVNDVFDFSTFEEVKTLEELIAN